MRPKDAASAPWPFIYSGGLSLRDALTRIGVSSLAATNSGLRHLRCVLQHPQRGTSPRLGLADPDKGVDPGDERAVA